MKRILSVVLAASAALSLLTGCGEAAAPPPVSSGSAPAQAAGERKQLNLWFWSAPAGQQSMMNERLADKLNAAQDRYELHIEYKAGNDQNIATALAANSPSPEIVFTSGPTYAANYAAAGKLANLDQYAEKYGWGDRLIGSIYNLGMQDGHLYALSNSLMVMGVFYNKEVLEENGWEIPETIEEMEEIMRQAQAKGLYGSVTGNKGWKPVNDNYSSLFLNHIAGPDLVYRCLKGEEKWNNPAMVEALNKSAQWYQDGFLGGDNYADLNFDESVQLLAMGQAPFFVGPSNVFQWAPNYFTGDKAEDFGFFPFPAANGAADYPSYVLGVTGCFSINANTPYQEECAEVLDYIMTNDFMVEMTKDWPGYWAIPLKEYAIPEGSMTGISAVFCDVVTDALKAIDEGRYGYYSSSFFPPATNVALEDIDGVWQGAMTAEEVLDKADAEFAAELEKGLLPTLPERSS